jgi:hypothetical protein
MAIVKRPQTKSADDFIKGAPDAPEVAAPASAVADEAIKRVMLGKFSQETGTSYACHSYSSLHHLNTPLPLCDHANRGYP